MQDFIETQCEEIAADFLSLKSLAPSVAAAAQLWIDALQSGRQVLFCGNGGSAADAQHLAAELTGRYQFNRRPLAGVALTTDTSAITAIANDFGYEDIFSRQVEALGKKGDVLYAISTSGNSSNVLKAIASARALGMKVIAVTGAEGGKMREVCDVLLNVPAPKANHIQEMHIAIGHMICGLTERALCG